MSGARYVEAFTPCEPQFPPSSRSTPPGPAASKPTVQPAAYQSTTTPGHRNVAASRRPGPTPYNPHVTANSARADLGPCDPSGIGEQRRGADLGARDLGRVRTLARAISGVCGPGQMRTSGADQGGRVRTSARADLGMEAGGWTVPGGQGQEITCLRPPVPVQGPNKSGRGTRAGCEPRRHADLGARGPRRVRSRACADPGRCGQGPTRTWARADLGGCGSGMEAGVWTVPGG
jgi:hypothetical protein